MSFPAVARRSPDVDGLAGHLQNLSVSSQPRNGIQNGQQANSASRPLPPPPVGQRRVLTVRIMSPHEQAQVNQHVQQYITLRQREAEANRALAEANAEVARARAERQQAEAEINANNATILGKLSGMVVALDKMKMTYPTAQLRIDALRQKVIQFRDHLPSSPSEQDAKFRQIQQESVSLVQSLTKKQ